MKTYIVSKHLAQPLSYTINVNDMVEVIYDEITVRGKVARYGILTIDNEQSRLLVLETLYLRTEFSGTV